MAVWPQSQLGRTKADVVTPLVGGSQMTGLLHISYMLGRSCGKLQTGRVGTLIYGAVIVEMNRGAD